MSRSAVHPVGFVPNALYSCQATLENSANAIKATNKNHQASPKPAQHYRFLKFVQSGWREKIAILVLDQILYFKRILQKEILLQYQRYKITTILDRLFLKLCILKLICSTCEHSDAICKPDLRLSELCESRQWKHIFTWHIDQLVCTYTVHLLIE